MAKDKIQLPSSQGGLLRYYDEYSSKIKIDKMYFIIFMIIIAVMGFILAYLK